MTVACGLASTLLCSLMLHLHLTAPSLLVQASHAVLDRSAEHTFAMANCKCERCNKEFT